MTDYGQAFKQIRKAVTDPETGKQGLTQARFAELLGMSRIFIAQIETGNGIPSDRTLSDICRIFNISPSWMETGEGDMFVELTKEESIAAFIGDVMSEPDGSFKKELIRILAGLNVEEWKLIEEMAQKLLEAKKTDLDGA